MKSIKKSFSIVRLTVIIAVLFNTLSCSDIVQLMAQNKKSEEVSDGRVSFEGSKMKDMKCGARL